MSDFASMKIADLKKELKAKSLPTTGNKQELVDRLQQAESTALLDDDLDHEDDQISEEAIKAAEEELKKQTDLNTSDEPSPAKKLKTSDDKENTIEAPTSPVKADGTPEKSATSPVEVLKARAERFGVQSEVTKKASRAERFGIAAAPEATEEKKSKKIGDAPPVDIDILKKRAERFGATVSHHVKQAEVSDAIKKRQERFGIVSKPEKGPAVKTNLGTNSVILDEKMLKRKERFNL